MSVSTFSDATLEAICAVLGDTNTGLTGSDIGRLLAQCGIDDPFPGATKRLRLFEALRQRQSKDGVGNNVVAFIQKAMSPARYISSHALFEERRTALNTALIFHGLSLGEDGAIKTVQPARTIPEAQERANRLRAELERRRVHPDVLKACRAELLQDNCFHAVLEATKTVADKIRTLTGLTCDGSELIDAAFGRSHGLPMLAFNTLQTDSERSEHSGMMNLMKGMFSTFRNPTAHELKTKWTVSEEDALDLLSFISSLHRRLDRAVRTNASQN